MSAAAIISAVAAVASVGASLYQGEQQSDAQKKALEQQKQAQAQAQAQAKSQERKSEMAQNAANRKQPDVGGIMAAAGQAAQGGPAGTMLTGPSGVDPNALSLGKSTLLGG